MARLLKALIYRDEQGNREGISVIYRVDNNERGLWLSEAEISGLSAAEIKSLAQTRADADAGIAGDTEEEDTTVIGNPIKETRQWYVDNPATQVLFDDSLADVETQIGALIDALFPNATAGQKTQFRKLLTALCANDRTLVHREFGI